MGRGKTVVILSWYGGGGFISHTLCATVSSLCLCSGKSSGCSITSLHNLQQKPISNSCSMQARHKNPNLMSLALSRPWFRGSLTPFYHFSYNMENLWKAPPKLKTMATKMLRKGSIGYLLRHDTSFEAHMRKKFQRQRSKVSTSYWS